MLAKKCFLVVVLTLLSVSLAIADPPAVHPTTGEPLVIDCLRGTPDAIDGDLSDWNLEAMTPAVLDAAEQLYSGQENWTGPEDCSGEVYLLWDDVNIYIAAVVKDEKLSMNKSGGDIWNADCVEVFFATTEARADHSWSNPTIHYQYGFNANNQKWNWCNMDGPGQSEPDYLQIAATETADGYICEAAIEYGQMLSLDFSAGNTIGLHSSIDDTDIENGDTELFMTWTGLAPHDQSMGFGHVILSAESVPEPEPVNPGTAGLVAHYAFENDANDSSGNGLNGTLVGEPVFTEGLAGYGMALDLDGVDDVVELGQFDVAGQITLAVWIMADDFEINDARIISKANEWGGNDHWWMLSTISETSLRFRLKTDDGQDTATLISDPALEAGAWAHIAASWDGSTMRLYKDGVEVASQEKGGTAVAVDPAVSVAIGSQPSDAFASDPSRVAKFFDGLIDEVAIYDRALSELEVLYLAGERATPVDPGTDGLMAYYPLDIDALDASGNGYDGTINGDPQWVEGKVGGALEMDGGDFVDVPGAAEINPESITLATWIYFSSVDGADMERQDYLSRGDDYAFSLHEWGYRDSTEAEGKISAIVTSAGGWSVVAGATTVEADTWYYTALTYDTDTQMLLLYLDGEVDGELSLPDGLEHRLGGSLTIGTYSGRDLLGRIDEIVIYDRALTGGEVRYLAGFRVPVENLLQNPSFEEDEAVLDDPDWVNWCTWNPAEGAGSNATIVDNEAADGARSLRIEPKGDTNWYFIVLYLSFPAELDKNYTTSFWAKAEAPRPLTVQMKAADNSIDAWGATDFELTTDWAEYSYNSEVLITDVKLEILCSGSEVPFWLDLVSVCEAD